MQGKRFLHSIRLKNLLSFGSEGLSLDLKPLNVLIGPNASGKSNLLEAISLIAATPRDLTAPFRNGGGLFADWIWKGGEGRAKAELEVSLEYPGRERSRLLDYRLALQAVNYRPRVRSEALLDHDQPGPGYFLREAYDPENHLKPDQSILAQLRDPLRYPELTFVGDQFKLIAFFRDWHIGRGSRVRGPQPADLPNDFLLENAANLGLVLNSLQNHPATKRQLLANLKLFYERVEDYQVKVEGGTVQIFLHERGLDTAVPATRVSDGTLHYLALLAILCHPEPPPLVCLEEPELGLHPDILPTVGDLLLEAAQRTQLIVTTHSETLVSKLSEFPEAVITCDRDESGTKLRRLDRPKLEEWLEHYTLGELWRMGEIGGNRW